MAEISVEFEDEGELAWTCIGDHLIDMRRVEHIVLTRAWVPPNGAQWREARQAMITFDIENRHYVVSFDTDEMAELVFEELTALL